MNNNIAITFDIYTIFNSALLIRTIYSQLMFSITENKYIFIYKYIMNTKYTKYIYLKKKDFCILMLTVLLYYVCNNATYIIIEINN